MSREYMITASMDRVRHVEGSIRLHKQKAALLTDRELIVISERSLATMEATLTIEQKTHRLLIELSYLFLQEEGITHINTKTL